MVLWKIGVWSPIGSNARFRSTKIFIFMLINNRTTAVLFDEIQSDQKYRNRVAYVVAHELAHQWFGNLVTMDWWNEVSIVKGFYSCLTSAKVHLALA